MTLGGILDTAIGAVFIYFLLSLIGSGILEVVAGIFAWRGGWVADKGQRLAGGMVGNGRRLCYHGGRRRPECPVLVRAAAKHGEHA
ncbi:MAG TPA: hypothetical protein VMU81_19120 [Acetobacteraceae bacterium]|jgi:hypothetical protein|nr:hypothetical protein [Acetobacteraceae bacterium]